MKTSLNRKIEIFLVLILFLIFSCKQSISYRTNTKRLLSWYDNIKNKSLTGEYTPLETEDDDFIRCVYNNYLALLKEHNSAWSNDAKLFLGIMSPILYFRNLISREEHQINLRRALEVGIDTIHPWSRKQLTKFLDTPVYDRELSIEKNAHLLLRGCIIRDFLLNFEIDKAEAELKLMKEHIKKKSTFWVDYFASEISFVKTRLKEGTENFSTDTTVIIFPAW